MRSVDLLVEARQAATCAGPAPRKGKACAEVSVVSPCAVAVAEGLIVEVGAPDDLFSRYGASHIVRHDGALVPGLVDAHTHPVFAGSRLDEFKMRAEGATYQEIHARGGGILSTVKATRASSAEILKGLARARLMRMLRHGTTTMEAKSGYGLTVEDELKALRLLRELDDELPVEIVTTFMGAHAIPPEFAKARSDYVSLIVDEMIPRIAEESLADFTDVFCEEGAFALAETEAILRRALQAKMGLRLHTDEFTSMGGVPLALSLGAASCDHLLGIKDEDIERLAASDTVAVLMPGTAFFLGKSAYAPARKIIEAGGAVALGTDFNAGSCMSESMAMALSLAVLQMKMTPEEALSAATINAAYSLGRHRTVGSIEAGKKADFLLIDCGDYGEWPYHFGVNLVRAVFKEGECVLEGGQG
jgi:imidazolonepropionase